MKIDLSTEQPVIDASDLATAFDVSAEQIKKLMRSGEVTSQFETGVDANAGTHLVRE